MLWVLSWTKNDTIVVGRDSVHGTLGKSGEPGEIPCSGFVFIAHVVLIVYYYYHV